MHSPAAFDPETGQPTGPPSVGWTSVFADELVALGARRPDVVAITAAMLGPTGLAPFAAAFPERCFDVGIAEQHALTSAAGLAMGGLHPVVARLLDVPQPGVRPAADGRRAAPQGASRWCSTGPGVTGNDGPSHNGMWDLSILGVVPGHPGGRPARRRHAARGAGRGRRGRRRADRDALPEGRGDRVGARGAPDRRRRRAARAGRAPTSACRRAAGVRRGVRRAGRRRGRSGWSTRACVTVVDPRWVLPVPEVLVDLARGHRLVVTVDDCGRHGGFGSRARRTRCATPSATCRCATSRSRSTSSTTAAGRTCWPRPG